MDDAPPLKQRIYEMLMESQFWPPETMRAYQCSQLASLLRHARATVPFYRSRLDRVFRKDGDIDWERWHEIPLVTRADLRDRRAEMLAAELPPGHGPAKTFYSSGSSGIPVAVEVTPLWSHANRAAADRFHKLHDIDPAKTSASLSTSMKTEELARKDYFVKSGDDRLHHMANPGRRLVLNRSLPESRKLDILAAEGVTYLFDIPNNAEVTAIANLSRKNPVKLEAIMFNGQGLTKDQRQLFQESFGARSLPIYSSEEAGIMGFQCTENLHYHLNPETVLVEILGADGQICEPGRQGRVVVTPFFSTALPLVRYEQGDSAEIQYHCTCKSGLPVIANISGRQDQFMRFPEGIRSATGLDQKLIRENLNALAFQIAQVETFKLEFRFVPADTAKEINPDPIVAQIRKLIHPKLDVVFKPMKEIPLNSGGKHQRIVCEIAPQS